MERQSLTQGEFVEVALEDVFDALATQDHLDGSHFTDTITPNSIAVDLYVTPQELHEVPEQIGGDISILVQAFCEEFTIPYLERFMEHCSKENIMPPHWFAATPVNPTGSLSLPAPLSPTGAQIQCSARSRGQFQCNFIIAASPKSPAPPNVKSAAVKQATALASIGSPKVKQHQNAEAFSLPRKHTHVEPKVFTSLLSIGPNTDAVLDRFNIGNEVIFKLRELITTVCSSCWEVVLRSPKWDLTYEQACWAGSKSSCPFCEAMPSQSLYTTDHSKCSQGLSRCRPKVILSKEARALLTSQRRQKSKVFKDAIDEAWLSQTSSRKMVLQDLLHNYSDEYRKLSQDEKDRLVKEYEENKLHKSKGIRVSVKSKINDVTQTLKTIKNKLNSLKCCTDAETILYTVHGSTDLSLCGIIFTTEGVNDFMVSIMNINDQDLVSKMEGFAIQGMRGAAHNHKDRCSAKWALIRQEINHALQEITGVPKAMMQWVNYWCNIVQHYRVICEGWPGHIPFKNLSEASSSLPKLDMLLDMWKTKLIYWRLLDEAEYQQLLREHQEKLKIGETRGKKRVQPADEPLTHHHKKVYKSLDTIESSDKEDNAPHKQSSGTGSTLASLPSPSSTQPSAPSPSSVQPSVPSPVQPSASTSAPSSSQAVSASGAVPDNMTHTESLFPFIANFDFDGALADLDHIYGPIAPLNFSNLS
ncbi:hypothetical protein EDB19DRAFT_1829663 [Suillus lakei]|nr:hypothetical protein EDB19DRAFT_1829663 [Suillus lakei]